MQVTNKSYIFYIVILCILYGITDNFFHVELQIGLDGLLRILYWIYIPQFHQYKYFSTNCKCTMQQIECLTVMNLVNSVA